jgi:hypothetical protein
VSIVIHVPRRTGWATYQRAVAHWLSIHGPDVAIAGNGDIMPTIPLDKSTIHLGLNPVGLGDNEPYPIDVVWTMERSRHDFHPDGGLVFTGPTPRRRRSKAWRKADNAAFERALKRPRGQRTWSSVVGIMHRQMRAR